MSLYTVDVYSGSSDNIIRDQHADGVIIKATQGTGYVNANFPGFYNSMSKKPTITAFFEV